MTLNGKISVLISLHQILGIGDHERQEHTSGVHWSASTCPVRLLRAFAPGTGHLRIKLNQPLSDCVFVPLGFSQINTWTLLQTWSMGWQYQHHPGGLLEVQTRGFPPPQT